MDANTAHILAAATNRFYAQVQESFSETRQRPWPGWLQVLECIKRTAGNGQRPLRVLDLGCGNMRFERFLQDRLDDTGFSQIDATMIDSCRFASASFPGRFIEADIIQLLERGELASTIGAAEYDLVVAFGVMHHIPTAKWRSEMLRAMANSASAKGIVAVSLWRPLDSKRIAKKAKLATELGCRELGVQLDIENGDALLGWQDAEGAFRYCHYFSDAETSSLAKLAERQGCEVEAVFSPSDGSDSLNTYLILRKP